MSDWTEVDTFDCPIEMASSKSTLGLQVIDVVLWLVKRYMDRGFEGFPACTRLANLILSRSTVVIYTQDELREEVQRLLAEVMNTPLTKPAEQRATQVVASIEQARKERMSEPVIETKAS